jgi:hypothetical protein
VLKQDYVDKILPSNASTSVMMGTVSDLPPPIQTKLRKIYYKVVQKACFNNALSCMVDPAIFYVEGVFSLRGIPVEHAWNRYGDIHFDLTSELLFDGNISLGKSDYVSIQESDDKVEVKSWVSSSLSAMVRVTKLLRNKS